MNRFTVRVIGLALGGCIALVSRPAMAADSGDFALGQNAEGQACRAVERFDAPKGGSAVDIYCGAWARPSGWVVATPASDRDMLAQRLAVVCQGPQTALSSAEFTPLGQIACAGDRQSGVRRYGLVATRGAKVLAGSAYPADWAPLMAAARVLAGVVQRRQLSAAEQSPPGLREIEAVFPSGPPGQGAELNYELLRRRAFERNLVWTFAGAEQDFEALLRAHDAVAPDDKLGRAEILAEIGLNLSNAGRFGDADDTFTRAGALAQGDGSALIVGKIMNYQALDLLNQHRYAAARGLALQANRLRAGGAAGSGAPSITATDARIVDRATSDARRSLLPSLESTTSEERSAVFTAQGFFIAGVAERALGGADADTYLARAAGALLLTRSPPAWLSSAIANEEAEVRLARGDAAGAASRAREGLVQVRLVAPETRPEAHLLLTLSRAQAAMGQSDAALESGRSAIRIFAHQLEEPGLPADLAAGELSLLLTRWSQSPSPALASEYFETLALTWDGAAAHSASELAARLALGGAGDKARAYQDAERAAAAAVAARQRLALEGTSTPAAVAAADAAVKATANRMTGAEEDLRARAPAYLELLNPSVSAADLQSALGEKEGYLRIVMAPGGGFGALVTHTAVHPFAIAMTVAQSDALAARIRRTTSFRGRRLPAYDIDAAAKLYAGLIGPVADQMGSLDSIEVDVSGSLASIPFAALVEAAPQGEAARKVADDEDYSGVDWFARRLAITNALGPASFVRFRKSRPTAAHGGQMLAAFADFHPDPQVAASRIAQDHALPAACQAEVAHVLATLGPLPDTADEAKKVGANFDGQVRLRLGGDFTDVDFMGSQEVSQAEVILLATHGVLGMSPCFPEPSLLTSVGATGEGLIEASHVLDRRLEARLVILSACDTAGGGRLDAARSGLADGGEALSGLVRGFLYAGVPDVLATEWKVDSATSATEVTSFLQAASKPGADLAGSLASAQRALYASPETAHPFFWAAFILVGDGQAAIAAATPPAQRAS